MRARQISIIALLTLCMTLHAGDNVYFNHIDTGDGLSHNAVTCTMTDSRGFLWIGTYNGLNRYDGNSFHVFYKDAIGSRSDFITSICEDGGGNIWIGTDNALFTYSPRTEKFSEIHPDIFGGHRILEIEACGEDVLVNVADKGLIKCSKGGETSSICGDRISRILETFSPEIFGNCRVRDIAVDSDGTMFLSDEKSGLYMVSPDRSQVRRILDMPLLTDIEICDSHVFVASSNGLVQYSKKNGTIDIFSSRTDDNFSISEDEITCISTDRFGNVYLGGYGGINIIHPESSVFEKYYRCGDENLKRQLVRCFIENNDGSVTVMSKTAGAFRFNPRRKSLEKDSRQFPGQIYSAIRNGGEMLISTSLGIWRLRGGRLESIPCQTLAGDDETQDRFYNILRTSSSEIYASHQRALLKYSARNGRFENIPFFDGMFADDLKEDSRGNVWISTYEAGLFICDRDGGVLRSFNRNGTGADYIPGDKVMCSFEDRAGRIWISIYNSGLYCMEDPAEGFRIYPVEFEECKVIYDIFEDRDGGLWLTTGSGLVMIDLSGGAQHFYTMADGLLNNSFEYSSHLVAADGTVYIGSSDGFIRFSPSRIVKDSEISSIIFTDFLINGERVCPGKGSPLKESISCTDRINLKAKQNNISFNISLISSKNSGKRLLYRLDGHDSEWKTVSASDEITYSHLGPGQYLLHVKGISGDGIVSDICQEIKIVIRRPMLLSKWAVIIYSVLIATIALGLYLRFEYKRRKRKKYYRLIIERAVARARSEAIEETERRMLADRAAAEADNGEAGEINARDRQFIEEINDVILKNIENFGFSSGNLAKAMGMSSSTLNRKMQELFDTSPNDYIRQTRLNIAALLIKEGSLSIKEIGYKVGFGTPSYFIKCFKAQFGCLPTEYKKNG